MLYLKKFLSIVYLHLHVPCEFACIRAANREAMRSDHSIQQIPSAQNIHQIPYSKIHRYRVNDRDQNGKLSFFPSINMQVSKGWTLNIKRINLQLPHEQAP